MKRVGLTPLKQHIFTESSGSSPTQTTLFYGIEWVTLPSQNYIYCKFVHQNPLFSLFSPKFHPLVLKFFAKTSGDHTTRTTLFHKNEWG